MEGDRLRWRLSEDGGLLVEVVHRRRGTFEGFGGYECGPGGDVVRDHDTGGVSSVSDEANQ